MQSTSIVFCLLHKREFYTRKEKRDGVGTKVIGLHGCYILTLAASLPMFTKTNKFNEHTPL
jgi:hypothetical protein